MNESSNKSLPNILVVGYGVIGEATAWLLKVSGHTVGARDISPDAQDRLRKAGFDDCDAPVVVICVPAEGRDGRLDTRLVDSVVGEALDGDASRVYVRTTLPVGHCRRYNDERVVYWPSFARDATALADEMTRRTFLFGTHDGQSAQGQGLPAWYESYETAEMAKLVVNAFLAMSVSFANETALICRDAGIDYKQVEAILRADHRIGKDAHLDARGSWDGKCLPKDVDELINAFGLEPPSVIRATRDFNDART